MSENIKKFGITVLAVVVGVVIANKVVMPKLAPKVAKA